MPLQTSLPFALYYYIRFASSSPQREPRGKKRPIKTVSVLWVMTNQMTHSFLLECFWHCHAWCPDMQRLRRDPHVLVARLTLHLRSSYAAFLHFCDALTWPFSSALLVPTFVLIIKATMDSFTDSSPFLVIVLPPQFFLSHKRCSLHLLGSTEVVAHIFVCFCTINLTKHIVRVDHQWSEFLPSWRQKLHRNCGGGSDNSW